MKFGFKFKFDKNEAFGFRSNFYNFLSKIYNNIKIILTFAILSSKFKIKHTQK